MSEMKMGLTEVKSFNNEEFGAIRALDIDGKPWFVGKDVAVALGYSNHRDALCKHVDSEDKGKSQFATPSGEQTMIIINESGLYALIFGSKLESAKRFKHWVTSEVLPSIRKTGIYGNSSIDEKVSQQLLKNLEEKIVNMMLERLERPESQSMSGARSINPFGFSDMAINDERLKELNIMVSEVAELYEMEWNKTLHFLYKTTEEDLGVSLNSYLAVYQTENNRQDSCILHVIAANNRLYYKAKELCKDAIQRKRVFG